MKRLICWLTGHRFTHKGMLRDTQIRDLAKYEVVGGGCEKCGRWYYAATKDGTDPMAILLDSESPLFGGGRP